jgi:hypothetical protein
MSASGRKLWSHTRVTRQLHVSFTFMLIFNTRVEFSVKNSTLFAALLKEENKPSLSRACITYQGNQAVVSHRAVLE